MIAHLKNEKIIKTIGIFLMIFSLFILYGWLGATDPECDYTMEVFVQLRLCDEYIGKQNQLSIFYPIGSLLSFAAGLLCIKFSGDKEQEPQNNKES